MKKVQRASFTLILLLTLSIATFGQVYDSQIGIPLQLGQIGKPTSVARDASGNFYVGDTYSGTITKFDSNGDAILKWGSLGTGDGQFNSDFVDIAIDGNGDVFVLDNDNNRIQKFSSTGIFILKWGAQGNANGEFQEPIGIAIDGSNNVYVSESGSSRVQKFSNTGVFITKWGTNGSGDGQFNGMGGIAVDGSNNVYVADWSNRIQKFNSSGVFITKWGSFGTGDGQFNFPWAIEADGAGNIYVSDNINWRIQKFSNTGTFLTKWGSQGAGDGQFSWIFDIETDGAGNVYVPDPFNGRIQIFTSAGIFTSQLTNPTTLDGQFYSPRDVAVDNENNLYVLDASNSRIQKFDGNGTFITKWGSIGAGDGQFSAISDIAIDANNIIYVADGFNHRIQKFNSNGTFLGKWGTNGTGNGQFSYASSVAVDLAGNVFVADQNNYRIQKFTNTGTFVAKWGSQGAGDGQFNGAIRIAIDANNNVYVLDSQNNRVQKFTNTGTFVSKWGTFGSGDGELGSSVDLGIDAVGNIFIVSAAYLNPRIQKFSSAGSFITKWGSFGSGDNQFASPSGITISSQGGVFISDQINNRVQKFLLANSITSFDPPSGPIGTLVTINGAYFKPTPGDNSVYFGAAKATVTSASLNQLIVTAPSGATYRDISVTANGLTSSSNRPFTTTFPSSGPINEYSLSPKVNIASVTLPTAIDMADFDVDGKTDLVITSNSGISIFRNKSTLGSLAVDSFDPPIAIALSSNPGTISIGDLDRDGKLDIVVPDPVNGKISLIKNISATGSLGFAPKVDLPASSSSQFITAIGDLDGDGRLDLVEVNLTEGFSVFRNVGEVGTLTTASFENPFDFATGSDSRGIAIGDLDRDGKPEIVLASIWIDKISVFKNTSSIGSFNSGSFGTAVEFSTGLNPNDIAIGDLDGDGNADLTVSNSGEATISIFRSTGIAGPVSSGSFEPKVTYARSNGGDPRISIGDLTGDGKPDFVVSNHSSFFNVIANKSTGGAFTASSFSKFDFATYSSSAAIGDLDGDSRQDLAFANFGDFKLTVIRNTVEPGAQPANLGFTSLASSSFTGNFVMAQGSPDGYLVLMCANVSPDFVPTDGVDHSVNQVVGITAGNDVKAVHIGNTNSFDVSSLVPGTNYFFKVYAYNGSGANINYNLINPLQNNQSALTSEPAGQPTALSFTNVQSSSFTVGWTAPSGAPAGYIVLRKTGASPSDLPVDGSTYLSGATIGASTVAYVGSQLGLSESGLSPSTQYFYDVFSYNGSESATNYLTTLPLEGSQLTPAPDTSIPQFGTNSTPGFIAPNTALPITADFMDAESSVSEGVVQYRSVNASGNTYTDGTLTKGSGNSWTGSIPSTFIGELGVEYKLKIKNGAGLEATSTLHTATVKHEGGIAFTINTNFAKDKSNYRIISIPIQPSQSVNAVFSEEFGEYNDKVWRMYRYENGLKQLNGTSPLEAGKGFWFISTKAPTGSISSGTGNTVAASSEAPFEISISPGWNQIGNPYNFDISWTDVVAANPTISSNLTATARSYNGNVIEIDEIKKFEGAYISFTGSASNKLKIPVTKNTSINGRIKSRESKMALDQEDWVVRFTLSNGLEEYALGGIGMHPGASEGLDKFDDFNVPRFFDYLELSHPKDFADMNFTLDVVPTQEHYAWNFTTETNQPGDEITLAWDNSFYGDGDEQLWLMNRETGALWDMRKENKVTVDYRSIHQWRVAFGSKTFVEEATLPEHNSLIALFPNPFDAVISIEIALTEPSDVKLEMLDLSGRNLHSIWSKPMEKGRHHISWNVSPSEEVTSGIYIVRFQSGTQVQYKRLLKN